ncbi:zinc ribbon domain-containing protein [Nonomuraea solani]|uniref:zinc ribbon domain-containing protein n=1 Tax=Nonomuraea solani TaxID=1144553 RepID=UPI000CDF2A70|nr:zinc ribbon domain-containing protein [Nonomuraea solani]
MSRHRLDPPPVREAALMEHCEHARFVRNLAVEQCGHRRPGRKSAPGFAERCRRSTETRAEFAWLRAGSIIVRQQDFAQAMANFRRSRRVPRSARGTRARPGRDVHAKAALNRSILSAGRGRLVQRLEHKAPGRVVKVSPAYTSRRCSACRIVDAKARESQAAFRRRSCGYAANAGVTAARNIRPAAGHAVTAREGPRVAGPVRREPQPGLLPA